MSTNFYWKEVPEEIKNLASDSNKHLVDDKDYIFRHIGKRCSAGKFCKSCGTIMNKHGSRKIHSATPNNDILFKYGANSSAWKRECSKYYYEVCPCCGKKFSDRICTFLWTMLVHRDIIIFGSLRSGNEKLIVDENGKEYTCWEFLFEELDNSKFEDVYHEEFV